MIEDLKQVKVSNRKGNGIVCYKIPDMNNLSRTYNEGEEKVITFEELRKLSYEPGGQDIIRNYLTVHDEQALKELGIKVEPEYFYSLQDIIKVMKEGSLDQFLDCLDFAPQGMLDSIKYLSVAIQLNDMEKRKAIEDKTGFNVTRAIENKHLASEPSEPTVQPISKRRAAGAENTSANPSKPSRRVTNKN